MRTRTGYFIKRNGVYYVAWKIKGKTFMKSTGTRNRREAEQKKVEIMAPFIAGDEVAALNAVAERLKAKKVELEKSKEDRNPPLSLFDAWEEYLENPNRPDSGETTLEGYKIHFEHFNSWAKTNHPEITYMRDVSKSTTAKYATNLGKSAVSANTYNKRIGFLSLLFRVSKDKARIIENPWEGIKRKRQNPQGRRELTIDELRKICQVADGEMKLLVAVGIYTGLRLGDSATLRWSEVDLVRNIIRRIPNKTARRSAKVVLIPIHTTLKNILSEIPNSAREVYVVPKIAKKYMREIGSVTKLVQKHFKSCGIQIHKPGTGKGTGKRAVIEVGFHSLRHTFVSLCREANAPLAVVESIVGHSNPAMTRHYTHLGEEAAISAVRLLPDITGKGNLKKNSPKQIDAEEIKKLVLSQTSRNWEKIKTKVLSLL